jgi:D-alanyl-D-alanine carboxypeptidase (penicillin-binding protein 5/6)
VRYRSTDLVDALFVASGNDDAQALARTGGDPASAGDRMTATAAQLGATDTTAQNPTGLDADGQLTTPYDLAVLTRAAISQPEIRRAAGLAELTFTGSDGKARHLTSSNPLLGHYPGALGVKTGSTADAGQTFVGAAERNGTTIAVVLMQAPTAFGPEAKALLDWGFAAAPGTTPIALLPNQPAAMAAASTGRDGGPTVAAPTQDGGGISPLLALALALTVVAAAFTYWQGREQGLPDGGQRRRSGEPTESANSIRLPDVDRPDVGEHDDQSSSARESRKIFAP